MASGPIISWQTDGEKMETVAGFIFLGSKITADGDCSHEINRRLLLARKVMTNLESILKKQRHHFANKSPYKVPIVFLVVIYRCESWTITSIEELMLSNCGAGEDLRVPWTARRSNQSILKEISPEYSLKGLILKPKLQYFGHLMWRAISLEKTLMPWKIEARRRGRQRVRWLYVITTQWKWVWANSGRQ